MIYRIDVRGLARVNYDDAEQVALTRDFLNHREAYLSKLFQRL